MNNQELVKCSNVSVNNEAEYSIEYYLCSDTEQPSPASSYGILIKSFCKSLESTSVRFFHQNRDEVIDMINSLSQNHVFPCHLDDYVDDSEQINVVV